MLLIHFSAKINKSESLFFSFQAIPANDSVADNHRSRPAIIGIALFRPEHYRDGFNISKALQTGAILKLIVNIVSADRRNFTFAHQKVTSILFI